MAPARPAVLADRVILARALRPASPALVAGLGTILAIGSAIPAATAAGTPSCTGCRPTPTPPPARDLLD